MKKILESKFKENQKIKKLEEIQTQKGITLLVLIVTIIILLILAGITIGTLTGENGIINNTKSAKEQTEIANEKEILEKATVEAMENNKYGNIEENELQNKLDKETDEGETQVKDIGEVIKVLFVESQRNYAVDKDGNVRSMTCWETSGKDGNNYITNGDLTLQIGDYINYDANDKMEYTYTAEPEKTGINTEEGQTFSSSYETEWRLLGVEHSADGDSLMLIPTKPIQTTNSTGLTLKGATGYQYGIEELENICEIYGHGTGASYARAMKIEDINKITGYDPMNTGDGTVFRKGTIYEYGINVEVTRTSYAGNTLKFSNGLERTYNYTAFKYFNENREWITMNIGDTVNLTNTYYTYYPTTLTDSSTGEEKGIGTDSREYDMMFSGSKNYWLASSYELGGGTNEYISYTYGLFNVGTNYVRSCRDNYLINVVSMRTPKTKDIMPIIYLNIGIQLQKTEEQINSCAKWELNK